MLGQTEHPGVHTLNSQVHLTYASEKGCEQL